MSEMVANAVADGIFAGSLVVRRLTIVETGWIYSGSLSSSFHYRLAPHIWDGI